MVVLSLIVNIIYIVICVAIIVIVLLQAGRTAGISGAIAGGAETFFGKNKGRAYEAILSKYTGWIAILFLIISVALVLLMKL
jgi:preprotein translocase subunit SecG